MQPDTAKLLEDVRDAGSFVIQVTQSLTQKQYENDRLVRQAVERNFEIIGEAINRLSKTDPETARQVGEVPRIVAFRNLLSHGYDIVDHEIVWHVIQDELPPLVETVTRLLQDVQQEEH